MLYQQFYAVNPSTGAAIAGCQVGVYDYSNALTSLFDQNGASITNPMTADSTGKVGFAAADGVYSYRFMVGGAVVAAVLAVQIVDALVLKASLAAEVARAEAAEAAEASSRSAAITTAVAAETTRAEGAEYTLGLDILAEAAAREAGVAAQAVTGPVAVGGKRLFITDAAGWGGCIIDPVRGRITLGGGVTLGAGLTLQTLGGGARLVFTDANGYAILETDGKSINGLDFTGAAFASQNFGLSGGAAFGEIVVDDLGYAFRASTASGLDYPAPQSGLVSGCKVARADVSWDAEVIHLISYGQSLSTGTNGFPLQTTSAVACGLCMSGRVRTQDNAAGSRYGAFSGLVETQSPDTSSGETVCSGAVEMIGDLTGQGQALLVSAPGVGGQDINQLSEGSATGDFLQVTGDLAGAVTIAAAAAKTYQVGALLWTQGENDVSDGTDGPTYTSRLRLMRRSIEGHARAAGGLKRRLPCVMYQVAQHTLFDKPPTIALAQAALAKSDDLFICIGGIYHLPYNANDQHLTGIGYNWLGHYYGRALKSYCVSGIKPRPLAPLKAFRQGSMLLVDFDVPVAPLAIRTDLVTDPGHYGFEVWDAAGVTNLSSTISSVSIVGQTRVKIVCSAAPPPGARVRYAYTGAAGAYPGPTTGPRGCLFDSCTDVAASINRSLINACVIFDLQST